jgi:hypothetical protein
MQALLDVILPVFLVIGFGYLAVWRGYFSAAAVDGLMSFTQHFAIPCLLFYAIARLDLGDSFDWRLLFTFYTGAAICFTVGLYGAHYLFGRNWEDSVAIGFCCLFSNSVLLGLPITERAFGPEALTSNYAIVAIHSPFCYGLGITVMEMVRARGQSALQLARTVTRAMFRNALILGIVLGFVVNLSGLPLPGPLASALEMMVRAALPAALFGMGGVLVRYRPEGDLKVIFFVCAIALVLHPTIVSLLGRGMDLSDAAIRSSVLTSAMAPGINTYVFANMYGRARRVAASAVLFATAMSIITVWLWLATLP